MVIYLAGIFGQLKTFYKPEIKFRIMKKQLLLLTIIFAYNVCSAQKLMTTYYDWGKQHISSQYYVNDAGVKNGAYKEYNEQGVVVKDYNYANGVENGPCSEYFFAGPTRYLRSTLTYKDGEFNGPAVYYFPDGGVQQKGNFVKGKREGSWVEATAINDPDLDNLPSDCQYFKYTVEYKDDKRVDGYVKANYYPSGRPYGEFYVKDGERLNNDETIYYPDGKLLRRNKEDDAKLNITTQESYYKNGKLKSYKEFGAVWKYTSRHYPIAQIIYESRSMDGTLLTLETSKDWIIISSEGTPSWEMENGPFNDGWANSNTNYNSEKQKIKIYQDKVKQILAKEPNYWLHLADSLSSLNNIDAASELLYLTWVAYPTDKGVRKKYDQVRSIEEEKEKRAQASNDSINKLSVEQSNLMTRQSNDLNELYSKFTNTFAVKKVVPFLMDQNGKPLTKQSYPKGESLYMKADEIIKHMFEDYNAAADFSVKNERSKNLINLLNKLISLPEKDAKELDKKVKTMTNLEEVKKLLLAL